MHVFREVWWFGLYLNASMRKRVLIFGTVFFIGKKIIIIIQKPITEQQHATHLLLLYPREQPIEGEASPVCCIIAPPVIYKRVYASTVSPGSKPMSQSWRCSTKPVNMENSLSHSRESCRHHWLSQTWHKQIHNNRLIIVTHPQITCVFQDTHAVRMRVILTSRDDWAILTVAAC